MDQAMGVLTSKATTEWFTPPEYIEFAREVLGSIDLDPASATLPQTWIRAGQYYRLDLSQFVIDPNWTKDELKRAIKRESRRQLALQPTWAAETVWLNSPFDDTPLWTARLDHEYSSGATKTAIQLCNSNLGYQWYERLWRKYPVCCVEKRIKFVNQDGVIGGESKQGQTFVYYGHDVQAFKRVFGDIGRIILPS